MNDRALDVIYLSGALLLAMSALVGRRAAAGALLRAFLAWVLIGTIVGVAVLYRNQIANGFHAAGAWLGMTSA